MGWNQSRPIWTAGLDIHALPLQCVDTMPLADNGQDSVRPLMGVRISFFCEGDHNGFIEQGKTSDTTKDLPHIAARSIGDNGSVSSFYLCHSIGFVMQYCLLFKCRKDTVTSNSSGKMPQTVYYKRTFLLKLLSVCFFFVV